MKTNILFFLLLSYGCSQNSNQKENSGVTTTVTSNDTIPIVRQHVSKSPIASYKIPINNPLLKQYFGVDVYETPLTFQFLLKMQYEGMIETDTLKVPNFGIWPEVKINKGPEKLSCIIGFVDKQKKFREYKMLVAKDDKLKLVVLKSYSVGVYTKTTEAAGSK